jgi:hypothetical protein
MMQVTAHPYREDRFFVDSATASGQRYQVILENADWATGDHLCTCPDAQHHPGRWCKHTRAVIQRIQATLPQDIEVNTVSFALDTDALEYRADPDHHENPIDAQRVFYQIISKRPAFYRVIHGPATPEEVIARAIRGIRTSELRLINDTEAQCWYVKNKAGETYAMIDATSSMWDIVTRVCAAADWYPSEFEEKNMSRQRSGGRYREYGLTHCKTHNTARIMSTYDRVQIFQANKLAAAAI